MRLASTRLIVADIKAMASFYEMVTGVSGQWLAPVFVEFVTSGATLAIGAAETVAFWAEGSSEPAANRTACIEFQVQDVDAEFERLRGKIECVCDVKTMPWGNRTFQFRDPEGNAISFYTTVTDEARKRFMSR
ncbi:VOC family protein [Acetobacter okinawensis]|uniref:VOC family protein n=1 Tax=Acetobacter okinawensis TaxID=1076594 RepID=UPI0039E959D7